MSVCISCPPHNPPPPYDYNYIKEQVEELLRDMGFSDFNIDIKARKTTHYIFRKINEKWYQVNAIPATEIIIDIRFNKYNVSTQFRYSFDNKYVKFRISELLGLLELHILADVVRYKLCSINRITPTPYHDSELCRTLRQYSDCDSTELQKKLPYPLPLP